MSEFLAFLNIGFKHITDLLGFDHILFVIALSAIYVIQDWKKLLVLITAFTVGHSATLALATLEIVNVNSAWVEFLIPITILLTGLYNLTYDFKKNRFKKKGTHALWPRYSMAVLFGLIHGLGFSNYLKSLLGRDNSIFKQLLAFNIGLEFGQIVIVMLFLLLSYLLLDIWKMSRIKWNAIISGIVIGMSVMLIIQKYAELP